jgi:phosphoribosyl-AMP cyclohydrolase / phosphoribosyl-ATP pyrophosphohydrolase
VDEPVPAVAFLNRLEAEIQSRRSSTATKSYTKSLLEAGTTKIGDKVREEADEFARAIAGESDERVAGEAADVVYHLLVGLASRGVSWRAVIDVLAKRAGTSGHAEKAGRQ